jgi:UDP-perosamine 4-acetyltransferase/acetyltransferase EpsM
MTDALIVWGAGGHARVVAELVQRSGQHRIVAFVDDVSATTNESPLPGVPVVARFEDAAAIAGVAAAVHVAVGDNAARRAISHRLLSASARLVALSDPAALVAEGVGPAPGTLVAAFARVGAGARLGTGVIINTGAIVEHDSRVADFAHLAPRVVTGGGASIGEGALLGIGAVILPGVCIGARAIIGAGAVVTSDVPDRAVARGCPARVTRIIE